VSILGVPLRYGADMVAWAWPSGYAHGWALNPELLSWRYQIRDFGDITAARPENLPNPEDNLKYLHEISATCQHVCDQVKGVLDAGELPVVPRW